MSIKLYHQVGFRDGWNVASFNEDHCGSGLILSPVHQGRVQVENLPAEIRHRSLFDPQYYLPNSPKQKLASYPFFPEQLTGGFSTQDFAVLALESATQCIDFQMAQEFEALVIPARFFDQMVPKYFEKQEEGTVLPFLAAIEKAGPSKDVFLTLPVTPAMLTDTDFRIQLLNWVTGFPEVSGVYVLVADDRPSKQIRSAELVFSYMAFAHELQASGLKPILSHLNTECVLLSVVENATLTMGAYENTRMFSIDKFIESDEERRSPKARIYVPGLLNWIQFDQAMQIREEAAELWDAVYFPTRHAEQAIAMDSDPHFSQPHLYRHYFVCMDGQIAALGQLPVKKRFEAVKDLIKSAMERDTQIEELPLDLDPHGRGLHLQPWLDGLNRFYRRYLKD